MKRKKKISEFTVLNTALPMSNAMYAMLVSKYSKTLEKCCFCSHFNGECGEFAKQGKCRAMDESINEVLVFHDGETEFATTRYKISKMLEAQHQSDYAGWIPETVDEVIDAYLENSFESVEYGSQNGFATSLYNNLLDCTFGGIIYELDWTANQHKGAKEK